MVDLLFQLTESPSHLPTTEAWVIFSFLLLFCFMFAYLSMIFRDRCYELERQLKSKAVNHIKLSALGSLKPYYTN